MKHSPALDAPLRSFDDALEARRRRYVGRPAYRRDPVTGREMCYWVRDVMEDGRLFLLCGETGDMRFEFPEHEAAPEITPQVREP